MFWLCRAFVWIAFIVRLPTFDMAALIHVPRNQVLIFTNHTRITQTQIAANEIFTPQITSFTHISAPKQAGSGQNKLNSSGNGLETSIKKHLAFEIGRNAIEIVDRLK